MKQTTLIALLVGLTACSGIKYQQEVYEKDGLIITEVSRKESKQNLCLNKAKMDARDNISKYNYARYTGKDTLEIDDADESFKSFRESNTDNIFKGTKTEVSPRAGEDYKGECHIRMSVPSVKQFKEPKAE
jgi:hypothetical protein